ncbi:putative heme oxygenase [Magnetospirillum gryphiswaldense MSR-1 v2]|uniref:Heme oxygenase n=1 Tax=Magnetospirillum gryphiswaldense (strain DSM 6361 / JCM 21280 / NBRC 15271 / MSR-1) TaxID=431944 RepID=V6EVG5_MAGGM|nr:biliverdin-producing heme oxygenase [Magnetospirillum gryphiswaldense]CDK97235.1 putative heme oxygenase [Magnetospirillum gryphiswaldense MSR-1 v2]
MDAWLQLRSATRSAHEAMERLPRLARLFADDYRRDELAALFRSLLAVHEPLEAALAGTPEAVAIGYCPRSPLLVSGLVRLSGGAGIFPPSVPIPAYPSSASRIGAFYVIEGSILGGQVIRRRLVEHFGEDIAEALAFYSPYGDDVGGQWIRFRTVLARIVDDNVAIREAESAAIATFSAIGAQLAGLEAVDKPHCIHRGSR